MHEAFREIGETPSDAVQRLYAATVTSPPPSADNLPKQFLRLRADCAASLRSIPVDDAIDIYRTHLAGAFDLEDLLAVSAYLGFPLDINTIEELMWDDEQRARPSSISYGYSVVARRPPMSYREYLRRKQDDVSFVDSDWLSTVTYTHTTDDGAKHERRFRGGVLVFGQEERPVRWETPRVEVLRPDGTNTGAPEAVLRYASDGAIGRREDILTALPCNYRIERTGELTTDDVADLQVFFTKRCLLLSRLDHALANVSVPS